MFDYSELQQRGDWGNAVPVSAELTAMGSLNYYEHFYQLPDKWSALPCDVHENSTMLTVQNMARMIFEMPSTGNTAHQIIGRSRATDETTIEEITFIMARYPKFFGKYTSIHGRTEERTKLLKAIDPDTGNPVSFAGESLAWTLAFGGRLSHDGLVRTVKNLTNYGIHFDDAQLYISRGVLSFDDLINYITNDIDISLVDAIGVI